MRVVLMSLCPNFRNTVMINLTKMRIPEFGIQTLMGSTRPAMVELYTRWYKGDSGAPAYT